jgi:hypothetical protein
VKFATFYLFPDIIDSFVIKIYLNRRGDSGVEILESRCSNKPDWKDALKGRADDLSATHMQINV